MTGQTRAPLGKQPPGDDSLQHHAPAHVGTLPGTTTVVRPGEPSGLAGAGRTGTAAVGATPAIAVQGLAKHVTDTTGQLAILDAVDFTVAKGETVAITGSSGSGKSTLLGLLAGLDVPSAGRVELAGNDLYALSEDDRARLRARHVGFVFQSFQLLPHLTAWENVMLPLELAGLPAHEPARDMLERVGLGERLRHYPKTLSGGEQQRVSLARAFVVRPDLLFADEPTGSLDSATGEAIINLMFDLHRENGTTLLMVTHDLKLAQRCGRQLVIAGGRLVRDSAVEAV
ncbi:ABC transporter ATP-binding protein [Pigmentiphaga litoralis]|jgi:putative ABC transport system ATP-binding protein|uniref:ABC transporter ATP-binding protein n=1 Tax=Pigmentiphaga litoralis TaxID=516702 RepID=UPI0016735D86|nr:ABC transporter ATP-binding protein [Pigmentiphaga litoralis]